MFKACEKWVPRAEKLFFWCRNSFFGQWKGNMIIKTPCWIPFNGVWDCNVFFQDTKLYPNWIQQVQLQLEVEEAANNLENNFWSLFGILFWSLEINTELWPNSKITFGDCSCILFQSLEINTEFENNVRWLFGILFWSLEINTQ